MKTVSQTLKSFSRLGIEEGFASMANAGYEALDLTLAVWQDNHPLLQDGYCAVCDRLQVLSKEANLPFLQAHAPFPSYYVEPDERNANRRAMSERSFEICGRLNIPLMIVHPVNEVFSSHKEAIEINVRYYRSILPMAKEYGVKIATENMWKRKENREIIPSVCSLANDFVDMVDAIDDPYLVACLDLGHAPLVGEDVCTMIRALGHDRLHALHVHDNDGKDDHHTLPYLGVADWDAITSALADIDYVGNMTLEADCFLEKFPNALFPAAHRMMADTARHLKNQFIEKRNAVASC